MVLLERYYKCLLLKIYGHGACFVGQLAAINSAYKRPIGK